MADEIGALEAELAVYKAQGRTDRAAQVQKQLDALKPKPRATKVPGKPSETTSTGPAETR